MYKSNFAVFLGHEKENGFMGFIAENNFYLILEAGDGYIKEEGRNFLHRILESINNSNIDSLNSFETILTREIQTGNLPINFSLAAGLLKGNLFYLKTFNEGQVYIKRNKKIVKLIEGNNSASGYIQDKDYIVFSSKYFNSLIGGEEALKNVLNKKPTDIMEELKLQFKERNDEKVIGLFAQFSNEELVINNGESAVISTEEVEKKSFPLFSNIKESFFRLNNLPDSYKKKKLTLIFVVVILFVLIWSVGFGVQRRKESQFQEEIKKLTKSVEEKIAQADESSITDLTTSLSMLSEAKQQVTTLETNISKDQLSKLSDIKKIIASAESRLLKKEEKNYEEFYDLTVDNKDAKGEKIYLDVDKLAILDKGKSMIYSLSLVKKSLEKVNISDIKLASIIASYEDLIFYYIQGEGIFKITDGKAKKIISNDKAWKEIISMSIYNGNIYVLDKGNDEIYKYLVAEGGYSDKQSYFATGSAVDLAEANSMAIDSAVYVGFSDYVAKYISGTRDEFKTNFPEENISLTKVFTNKQLDKVYAWDKSAGVIYIFDKKGAYEKQIKSSILSKASDFVVFKDSVYALLGAKIYTVGL